VEAGMSVDSALSGLVAGPVGFGRAVRGCPGVEWWLLENGTVTPKASAGVSRDTSPSIPHGETPSGATVHASRKELSGSDPGGSPISHRAGSPARSKSRWRV